MYNKKSEMLLLQRAREFVKEFKKFDRELARAETKQEKKEFDRLDRLNEKIYGILSRGGLSS